MIQATITSLSEVLHTKLVIFGHFGGHFEKPPVTSSGRHLRSKYLFDSCSAANLAIESTRLKSNFNKNVSFAHPYPYVDRDNPIEI